MKYLTGFLLFAGRGEARVSVEVEIRSGSPRFRLT